MTPPAPRMPLAAPFRLGRPEDAPVLAELVAAASEGLAPFFWERTVGAGRAQAYGVERMAARAEAGEWIVADAGEGAVAGLMGHRLPEDADPIPEDFEPLFRPLEELEHAAPGSWYVHVLATVAEARNRGWGTRLLALAEEIARADGAPALSIIVADNNTGARRLYERTGFAETARREMVKGAWQSPGTAWILMLKPLSPAA